MPRGKEKRNENNKINRKKITKNCLLRFAAGNRRSRNIKDNSNNIFFLVSLEYHWRLSSFGALELKTARETICR